MTSTSITFDDADALIYEETHVHSVYESIASHFSSTRYKPWPVVDTFLRDLVPGSIGLDVGCGNGKYLNVNKDVFIVGSDRSSNLIALAARHQTSQPQPNNGTSNVNPGIDANRTKYNADVLIADTLSLPHSKRRFDFAICIAVIHHLSSRERRIAAIQGILGTLKLDSINRNDHFSRVTLSRVAKLELLRRIMDPSLHGSQIQALIQSLVQAQRYVQQKIRGAAAPPPTCFRN